VEVINSTEYADIRPGISVILKNPEKEWTDKSVEELKETFSSIIENFTNNLEKINERFLMRQKLEEIKKMQNDNNIKNIWLDNGVLWVENKDRVRSILKISF
jgi:hypothetical protein